MAATYEAIVQSITEFLDETTISYDMNNEDQPGNRLTIWSLHHPGDEPLTVAFSLWEVPADEFPLSFGCTLRRPNGAVRLDLPSVLITMPELGISRRVAEAYISAIANEEF